jgi:hypothetical protein
VAALAIASSANAESLALDVSYSGMINGTPLDAFEFGSLDTTGSVASMATTVFDAMPENLHPAALISGFETNRSSLGWLEAAGAQNLFSLTGGNYQVTRLIEWPEFDGSSVLMDASFSLSAGVLSGTVTIDGVYTGPTDLVDGDEDYQVTWVPDGPHQFTEEGTSFITTSSGERYPVQIHSTFSGVHTPLAEPQNGEADFEWTLEENVFSVSWTGIVSPVADLLGDYNDDSVVNAADYVVWRNGLGSSYTPADYEVWRAHFGQTAGSGAVLPSAVPRSAGVPEPTSLLLVGSVGLCLPFRIKRAVA